MQYVKYTRAQLKIQQMAFMIIAVFIFFVLVGLFALNLVLSNMHKQANLIGEERAKLGVMSVIETPEFSCGKPNCVDADKLIGIANRQGYSGYWFFSSLEVIKLGKNESAMIDCNKANYPNCDKFIVYDKNIANQRKISNFIVLCRKEYENSYTYDKCEMAKIIVGIEEK